MKETTRRATTSQEDAKRSGGHRSQQGPGGQKGIEQSGTIFGTVSNSHDDTEWPGRRRAARKTLSSKEPIARKAPISKNDAKWQGTLSRQYEVL